jgi:tRNA1Val (adenine37-N6)-methyltransferase
MGQQKTNRNPFVFKQFTVFQDNVALPVTTDACLFGAWITQHQLNPQSYILDIGSGTGILTFMVAQKLSNATFLGLDIHHASIEAANISLSHWKEDGLTAQIQFENQNILQLSNSVFDVVISNPPFFSNQLESPNIHRNQARHTSELTLENLIFTIQGIIKHEGSLFLMYPFQDKNALISVLKKFNFCIEKITELAANTLKSPHLIFVYAIKKDENNPVDPLQKSPIQNRINLYLNPLDNSDTNTKNHYNLTPQSAKLLKDYYIKL